MNIIQKKCYMCSEVKPLTEFYPHNTRGYRAECKKCSSAEIYHRYKINKQYWKEYNLQYKYNINQEQWNKLFEQQGKVCAFCSSDKPKSTHGWQTDHNPKTGIVRGILCHACNVNFGRYEKLKANSETEKYLARGNDDKD